MSGYARKLIFANPTPHEMDVGGWFAKNNFQELPVLSTFV